MYEARIFEVMISSPSDLADARINVIYSVLRVNAQHRSTRGDRFIPVLWEQQGSEFGENAQDIIDRDITDTCDICIVMLRAKFGTPSASFESGTEHEFLRVLDRRRSGENVEVLVYFIDPRSAPERIDYKEIEKIEQFRSANQSIGMYKELANASLLESTVAIDIMLAASRISGRAESNDTSSVLDSNSTVSQTREPSIQRPPSDTSLAGAAESPLPEHDDIGRLDILEEQGRYFQRAMENMVAFSTEFAELGAFVEMQGNQLSGIPKSPTTGGDQKRIIDNVGARMERFSDHADRQIAEAQENLATAMKLMRRAMIMEMEDGHATQEELANVFANISDLIAGMMETEASVEGFASIIRQLPRMTKNLNVGKRRVLATVGRFLEFTEDAKRSILLIDSQLRENLDH